MMQNFDYLQDCRKLYDQRLLSKFGPPVGAAEVEITELQAKLDKNLPIAYRQFLLWMGKDKYGALKGSEWFIDEVYENGEFLEEFLAENEVKGMASNPIVCFFSHQAYMAAWFSLDNPQPDPLCEFYSEVSSNSVPVNVGPFSSFLLKELQGVAETLV
ncbi:SMI1/KNR4 family protein [Cohaesibacter gelatinilyticus]|uniref:Knr4/Smi1-like domain-containing protein n=1 Tax=Cohaesibacter gelatinilyticus TaxID=372072 RepID=A0A285PG98_9HYPH|nr:SMI1/KNR4 family protein [Cohaesibacter gelatinilyticus]SNZ20468.1 hypothetical protein SAMN06265368_3571 [Cohaesibacter gelatinilyticus]HAT84857.1 hypothetical protein [Hyphomicrobiales bacterium]